jgi:uncharacterized damage-inducible protein DinB
MRDLVASIEHEYRRYKALAESAMAQLSDEQLDAAESDTDNSITVIVWHVSGNLESRFSDFLVSDGEKPSRDRDAEFAARTTTRAERMARWEQGWSVLLAALEPLTDADLSRTLTIRGTRMTAHEALHRSLAHTAYHVGQIVYIAKRRAGAAWKYLSIPPGQSAAYNRAPTHESAQAHAAKLDSERRG